MTKPFATEMDMARHVVAYFESMPGWTVYQEVRTHWGGKIADIVVTDGVRLWVICCKLTLPLGLLEQAIYWKKEAHMVSIAVPFKKDRDCGRAASVFLRQNGIGVFSISDGGHVDETQRPSLTRRTYSVRLKAALTDDVLHRGVEAGDKDADFFTPFKSTVEQLKQILSEHPEGLSMRKLVDDVGHHYTSDKAARCSLAKWITEGVIKGIERRGSGRNTVYVLTEGG